MEQSRQYYAVIVLVTIALLGLAGGLPANEEKADPNWVLLPVGANSVRVTAPAAWHLLSQTALPEGGVSAVMVQEKSEARITLTVRPAFSPVELTSLQATLEETLRAYKQFHVTRASLSEVCGIPAVTVAGTLLEDGTDLQARIWVLAASNHLWELTLTFADPAELNPGEVITQLVGSLRIRTSHQQQWAKLSSSQQALLSYQTDQKSQQHTSQTAHAPTGKHAEVLIRDVDSCLREVTVGTALDEDDELVNAGSKFPADIAQLVVLLQVNGAPSHTQVTVQLFHGDRLLLQQPILVSGTHRFAVTIYPRQAETFLPGQYRCQVKVNDHIAWQLPIRIGE